MGNSSEGGRGYTKTSLNSSTRLEVARPRKSMPTICPQKGRNSLESINSKVGTWAPASSLLIQEAWPNCPRLASQPLKSCSCCNLERRCFKTLFCGQTIYQPPFMGVWSKNPQISSSADGKSRSDYILLWGFKPCHPLAYPQGPFPLSLLPRNLGPSDKTPKGIVRRSSDQSWRNLVH